MNRKNQVFQKPNFRFFVEYSYSILNQGQPMIVADVWLSVLQPKFPPIITQIIHLRSAPGQTSGTLLIQSFISGL